MQAWAAEAWATIQNEFSDVSDASQITRLLVRLGLAMLFGGLLGLERERHGYAAGLRTHMMVALGAALFVHIPGEAGFATDDMSRVLQGLVSGIGFLGAGAIIKFNRTGEVQGLTSAASLWLTAAIGVACGLGRETTAALSTLLALVILAALRPLHRRLGAATRQAEAQNGAAPLRRDSGDGL